MKRGKRIKPKLPIEYRLLLKPKFNEDKNKTVTLAALRTMTEFSSFQYEIIVESEEKDRKLKMTINGLRAPHLTFPGRGPALFTKQYENLQGLYDVIIAKPGKEDNKFSVYVSEKEIIVKQQPKNKFIEITTSESEW